jgi:glycosyltransferase involved in cell wall biosynthesis
LIVPKKKILIIENSKNVTGALKSITRSSHDLTRYFQFSFIIPRGSNGKFWIVNKGFTDVMELPMRELRRDIWSIITYLPSLLVNAIRLNNIVKKNHIDILHVNDVYNLLPVAIRLLGSSIPYICHFRFLPDRFPALLLKLWMKFHLRFASAIVAVSEKVRVQLPTHPKIIVIHNELPIEERYAGVPLRHTGGSHYFLYLSHFIQGKGQNFAIKAFAAIHKQIPGWRLRFVGGDMGLEKNRKYRNDLIEMAKSLDIIELIEWSDFVEDVEFEYKAADVVLNFSESESFSITCLEAQFFGRPLVATDCGGPAEIIENHVTGILVPNRGVDEMSEAMRMLAQDEKLRSRLAEAARNIVREKFCVQNTSYRLKSVYDRVLATIQ